MTAVWESFPTNVHLVKTGGPRYLRSPVLPSVKRHSGRGKFTCTPLQEIILFAHPISIQYEAEAACGPLIDVLDN